MIRVFYHKRDFDGECSAAIIKYHEPSAELIPADYGEEPDWRSILKPNDQVYIVDFSFPTQDMLAIQTFLNDNVIYIDHHYNKIKELEAYKFKGIQNKSKAACEHVAEYFKFKNELVTYLGMYDSWRTKEIGHEKWDLVVLPIQYALKAYNTNPLTENGLLTWFSLLKNDSPERVTELATEGTIIWEFTKRENARYMNRFAFEAKLEGLRALVVNRGQTFSQFFSSLWDERKHDVMVSYTQKEGKFHVSLYTTKDDLDLTIIARKFGGNGHNAACGCIVSEVHYDVQTKELIFKS